MALSGNTVWEVRTAGNDTNGGGFVTGASGSDYSLQDNKNSGANDKSTTDAVANGTTTITSATANFQTSIVGNIVYFQGGSGGIAAQWRQVTARASTTSITIDAAIAASTGMTMNIGGALASVGMVGASLVSGNICYIKSGSYSITTASTNVSGGCISKAGVECAFIGYNTTRLDWGTGPTLTASGINTFTFFTGGLSNSSSMLANMTWDGIDAVSSRGCNFTGIIYRIIAEDFTNSAITSTGLIIDCIGRSCSTAAAFAGSGVHIGCIAHSNSSTPFNAGIMYRNCIAYSNTGASTDGFVPSSNFAEFHNCVAYGNGRDGFRTTVADVTMINCIAEGNAGVGFNASGSPVGQIWLNNAAYNNGTNFTIGTGKNAFNLNSVTLTGSPFTNAAGGDFSLNNTASAGAACRAAGHYGTYIGGTPIGYEDIGAVQHQDPASSGGAHSAVF